MDEKNFVLCGLLRKEDTASEIVCEPTAGDVILLDELQGNVIIEQVTITDPTEMSIEILHKVCDNLKADGVIVSARYYYVIRGEDVHVLEFGTNKEIQKFYFDTAVEYDGEIVL